MSGLDRIDRLRALKNGLPADVGNGGPALRRKIEADEQGRHADLNQQDEQELGRLIAMLEVAFLAAAGDGELSETELVNLAGNFASWIGAELDDKLVGTVLDGFLTALEEQGLEARLAAAAAPLDPESRRVAYSLASAIVLCDAEVNDDELGVLGEIAGALEIPEDEAQQRFDQLREGLEAAMNAG